MGEKALAMSYMGRTRRRWFFFTQYEYQFHGYVGGRWQTPHNSDKWPICRAWTYRRPGWKNTVGFIDRVLGRT